MFDQPDMPNSSASFFKQLPKKLKSDDVKLPVYFGIGLIALFLITSSLAPEISRRLGLISQRKAGQQSYAKEIEDSKQRQKLIKIANVLSSTNLLRVHGQTIKANPKKRENFRKQLIEISKQRKQDLLFLLKNDPTLVKQYILSDDVLTTLKTIGRIELEEKVTLVGSYSIFHQDDFENPEANIFTPVVVTPDGTNYLLYWDQEIPPIKPPNTLTVTGYKLDNSVIVDSIKADETQVLGANTTTGDIPIAVILVNYSDTTTPLDMQKVRDLYQGNPGKDLNSYILESSFGKAHIQPSFFGPYTIPFTKSQCDTSTARDAVTAAADADVNYTQFKRLAFVRDCRGGGFGNFATTIEYTWNSPDGPVVLTTYTVGDGNNPYNLDTTAHELMHTLGNTAGDNRGNGHSSQMVCIPDAFRIPTNFNTGAEAIAGCPVYAYGDFTDNLGGSKPANNGSDVVGHPNATHKYQAGWFDANNYIVANTPGTHTYTISPIESPSSNPQAIFIPKGGTTPANSSSYWTIEYRQPIGFDYWLTSSPTRCIGCNIDKGAAVRLRLSSYFGDVLGIDTTPASIENKQPYRFDDFHDSSLEPGKTFTDPEYGYTIKTVSQDSNGLTVEVTIPQTTCTRAVPTFSATPSTQTFATPQEATYTITVTNNDSADCPAGRFRVYSTAGTGGGVKGDNWVYTTSPTFLTINPGASATTQLTATPRDALTDGTYFINYIALSSVVGFNSTSKIVSYVLNSASDTIPPSAPFNFQATAVGSKQVNLSWSAASDDLDLAGYRIYRDGVELSDSRRLPTSQNSFFDYWVLPNQTYTYAVKAIDRKNNKSPDSNPVTVTTPPLTDTQIPSVVGQFTISSINANSVKLQWSPASDNVAMGRYEVTDFSGFSADIAADKNTLTLDGLLDSSYKQYALLPFDVNGNVGGHAWYSIYTPFPGTLPPSRPENFTATPISPNKIDLSWTASTDDVAVAGYNVYRNYGGTASSYVQLFKIATVTTNAYSDTGVIGGTFYDYYVEAFDDVGNLSAPSLKILNVKTPAEGSSPSPTSSPTSTPTPTPTPTPAPVDSDGDGFSDFVEGYVGTDPNLKCGDNAWPPDINNDRYVDITDISRVSAAVGQTVTDSNRRLDLNADGFIDGSDKDIVASFFGRGCTP